MVLSGIVFINILIKIIPVIISSVATAPVSTYKLNCSESIPIVMEVIISSRSVCNVDTSVFWAVLRETVVEVIEMERDTAKEVMRDTSSSASIN